MVTQLHISTLLSKFYLHSCNKIADSTFSQIFLNNSLSPSLSPLASEFSISLKASIFFLLFSHCPQLTAVHCNSEYQHLYRPLLGCLALLVFQASVPNLCVLFVLFSGDDFAVIQQEILMMRDCKHRNIVAYHGSYLR